MPNGISVGADVTEDFNDRIEAMQDEWEHQHKSETIRRLLHKGLQSAEDTAEDAVVPTASKNASISLAILSLIILGWTGSVKLAAWMMLPSLLALQMYQLWPSITERFGANPAPSSG